MSQIVAVLIVLALLGIPQAAYVIGEWEQGIVTRFGQPIRTVREPGLYFKLPMLHTLTRFDKRVLAAEARARAEGREPSFRELVGTAGG